MKGKVQITPKKENDKIVTRKRSPNYPTIALEKAVSMVSKLYDKYQRHAVPAPLAMEAMGYSIKSGKVQSMLASISYYNLIQVERGAIESKKVNISNLGFTIIKNPDENEKLKAIKDAALQPTIFNKIFAKYHTEIPEDRLLAWDLEQEFDFNTKTIPDFIKIFKQTMEFAKVYESDIIEDKKEEEIEKSKGRNEDESRDKPNNEKLKEMNISSEEKEIAKYPVGKDISIRLIASGDITDDAIKKLIRHLQIDYDIAIDFKKDKTPE